ncbi:hypothetical protein B0A50_05372 [Salinomyces thailandicus]|uniref:Uncharacterized protein n=1 Tax=Salinomyces thailandicus TaxID=706561 RepID=A0A4U0TTD1_9PEZI|nr:hypothetical protein B0A50_05372 [Salinomyces thailandica]
MTNPQPPTPHTFTSLYDHLLTTYPTPLLPSPSARPHDPTLTDPIASLTLHPTLEALLHLLNADLTSAHFLCRHMQNRPAWEGMYIHGLLHRIEGDYRNAEAWYSDVADSDVFKRCWPEGGLEAAKCFIRCVERLRKEGVGERERLEEESRREIEGLVGWCEERFGTEKWEDATKVWVKDSEEVREMKAGMVVGGEGWRQF